jgi:hypothetical protein
MLVISVFTTAVIFYKLLSSFKEMNIWKEKMRLYSCNKEMCGHVWKNLKLLFDYFQRAGLSALIEVVITCSNFWDITPCSPLKFHDSPPKRQLTIKELNGVTSKKTELFTITVIIFYF